jgi:hypothetical protein
VQGCTSESQYAILEPTPNGSAGVAIPALAANLGLARPPAIYLTAIVTGLGLHFAWPIPFVPSLAMPFGAMIAALAALSRSALR